MTHKTKSQSDLSRRLWLSSREISIAVLLSLAAMMFWLATKAADTRTDGASIDQATAAPVVSVKKSNE